MMKSIAAIQRALRVVLILAAVMLWAPHLQAQNSALAPEGQGAEPDHRWAHFTQQPGGLASNDVWSVVATDDAIWFGAELGVSRYDGVWTNFETAVDGEADESDYGQPPQGPVQALALGSRQGEVLAGTTAGDLHRWDGQVWSRAGRVSSSILAIAEWQGQVYIGAAEGLYRLDQNGMVWDEALPGTAVFTLLVFDDELWAGSEDGLWRREGETWRRAEDSAGLFAQGVYALGKTADGRLAAGTAQGLALRGESSAEPLRDARTFEWQLLAVRDETGRQAPVRALTLDGDGRLWAGTDGAGAYEFTSSPVKATLYGPAGDGSLTTRYVRSIAVDADGSIWFGTPAGVFRFQAGMWTTDVQGENDEDPRNYVNDLLVDRQGRLWVATGGGGIRVKSQPDAQETVFTTEDGVPSRVLVLAEDVTGAIWAGTFDGVFRFADGVWRQPVACDLLPSITVTALQADGPAMWIGTEAGMLRYDTQDGSVQQQSELDEQSIEALMLDGQSRLWVGTQHSGVWQRSADGSWTKHVQDPEAADSIPGNWIIGSGLAPDWREDGHIWAIVYREGLAYWDGQTWSDGAAESHVASSLMWTLETDPDAGMLWVGSEAGVSRYDGRTWGSLTTEDGLHSAVVHAVAKVKDGEYWIGGPTGLSYYRPDRRPPWIKVGPLTRNAEVAADGEVALSAAKAIDVPVGEALLISFTAGDLQTPQNKLKLLHRRTGPGYSGEWEEISPGMVEAVFEAPGVYQLEFVARDQSFNYSEPAVQEVNAFVPPPKVDVPGLGQVAPNIFRALAALGLISVLGAGYITFEVLQHRQRSIDAVNRNFNPYVSGEPVRRNDMFYARRDLVQRIVNMLHNNSIMIHGERRIGKTTLLFQLMAVLRDVDDPEYWFVPIYVDLEGTPQELFFHFLIEEVIDGVLWLPDADAEIVPELEGLRCHGMAGAEYADRDFNRDMRRIIDVLQAYGSGREDGRQLRVILLLDEMDVMSKYDHLVQQQLRRIFMREFATTVGAVVAGIRISKDWDRVESPWYNLFNEIELEPFAPEQALELLIAPVQGYYRYEPDAIQFILDHAEGRPYRVQQYGLEAVNQMLADRRRKILMADVLAAHEQIEANGSLYGGVV